MCLPRQFCRKTASLNEISKKNGHALVAAAIDHALGQGREIDGPDRATVTAAQDPVTGTDVTIILAVPAREIENDDHAHVIEAIVIEIVIEVNGIETALDRTIEMIGGGDLGQEEIDAHLVTIGITVITIVTRVMTVHVKERSHHAIVKRNHATFHLVTRTPLEMKLER